MKWDPKAEKTIGEEPGHLSPACRARVLKFRDPKVDFDRSIQVAGEKHDDAPRQYDRFMFVYGVGRGRC